MNSHENKSVFQKIIRAAFDEFNLQLFQTVYSFI